jgi:UDP-N-acetyl-D-mannosaminuronic acid transferase (WecB/TagA/CpsF family)
MYPKAGEDLDKKLLESIEFNKPRVIFIQIGGGIQERLGLYLKSHLSFHPTIICSGAALAFLSGQQVRIPRWVDRFYLGWLLRCMSDPKTFIPRYFSAFRLVYLLFKYGKKKPVLLG